MSGEAGGVDVEGPDAQPADERPAASDEESRQIQEDHPSLEVGEGPSTGRAEEYLLALQRLKADFDNYRRRTTQDQARWGEAAVAAFVTRLLPVVDNLERAAGASGDADAVRQGVEMTLRQMRETLASAGIVPLEALGQPFDPERHEAVARGPVAGMAEGSVAEEYRRGYLLRGTVLRPALVKVAAAPAGDGPDGTAPAEDGGEEGER